LWAEVVPAHAKSRIMTFEPGAFMSDGWRKAGLKGCVDDKW